MKKILTLIFIGSMVQWFITLIPSAHAQSSTLSISPPVIEIILRPNQAVQETFLLQSTGPSVSITPELHRVLPQDNAGHVTLDPNPLNLHDLPLVLSTNPPLDLPFVPTTNPTPLSLTLSAANLDTPTDIYLALVLRATPTDPPQISSLTSPAISSLIFITITPTGVLPLSLSTSHFDLPLFHDSATPLLFTPQVNNQNSIMLHPSGNLAIISPTGQTHTSLPLYPHLVLGNSSRQLSGNCAPSTNSPPRDCPLSWQPHFSNLGPYRFRLTLQTQGGTTLVETEKVIWILPLRLLALMLILVILTLIILTYLRRPTPPTRVNLDSN